MSVPSQTFVATSVIYYSPLDERAFFEWLDRIDCVARYDGLGSNLTITLSRAPDDDELREFIALFHRYGVDMRQLAVFGEGAGRAWFRKPSMFWTDGVFGSRDVSPNQGD